MRWPSGAKQKVKAPSTSPLSYADLHCSFFVVPPDKGRAKSVGTARLKDEKTLTSCEKETRA
jgi:hypothetical protein